jgi:hypothetical protein
LSVIASIRITNEMHERRPTDDGSAILYQDPASHPRNEERELTFGMITRGLDDDDVYVLKPASHIKLAPRRCKRIDFKFYVPLYHRLIATVRYLKCDSFDFFYRRRLISSPGFADTGQTYRPCFRFTRCIRQAADLLPCRFSSACRWGTPHPAPRPPPALVAQLDPSLSDWYDPRQFRLLVRMVLHWPRGHPRQEVKSPAPKPTRRIR